MMIIVFRSRLRPGVEERYEPRAAEVADQPADDGEAEAEGEASLSCAIQLGGGEVIEHEV